MQNYVRRIHQSDLAYGQGFYLTHTSLPLINWATIVCGGLGWPGWPVGILLLDTIVCRVLGLSTSAARCILRCAIAARVLQDNTEIPRHCKLSRKQMEK